MTGQRSESILVAVLVVFLLVVSSTAFQISPLLQRTRSHVDKGLIFSAGDDVSSEASLSVEEASNVTRNSEVCFYMSPTTNWWAPRLELSELEIGQELVDAVVVQEKLDGRTGPKVWVDCGVGRMKEKKNKKSANDDESTTRDWNIQHAMLRLGGPNMKPSVARKKASRLRKKSHFPVYVSRIRLENDQMEVVLSNDDVPTPKDLRSVSSLTVGEELTGTIVRVADYGVFVDVGANRPGLLHITQVGNLYNKFIKQSEGLRKVGLSRGVQVEVQVTANDTKRLALDFSKALKQQAEEKYKKEADGRKEAEAQTEPEATTDEDPYADLAAEWAAAQGSAAASDDSEEEDDDPYAAYAADYAADAATWEEEEGDYDEDRDIEDAMGLGFY